MKTKETEWRYDEFKPVGRDYGSQAEVDVYDSSHADFRDIAAESRAALDRLEISPGGVLVEYGSGTGGFAIEAARRGLTVHAVDVSEAMIGEARCKADEAEVSVEFHHAGFLSFEFPAASVDAIASTFAFHHLPDYWKGVALKRMYRMLKPGGRLYLRDVVIEEENSADNINALIDHQEKLGGDFLRQDALEHFRDEFSTYDWVMDGLLERAGFRIDAKDVEGGLLITYLATKP